MLFELATGGDRDGVLSLSEFTEMLRMRLGHRPKEDSAKKWFHAMDAGGEGGDERRRDLRLLPPQPPPFSSSSVAVAAASSERMATCVRVHPLSYTPPIPDALMLG